jgi:mono/diheme cytochrome c family protein
MEMHPGQKAKMQPKAPDRRWLVTLILLATIDPPHAVLAQTNVVPQPPELKNAQPRAKADLAILLKGGKLFRENCAQCHGPLGQGHPHWNKADANGKYPPPPLNGTGHTWHHPEKVLKQIIRDGTGKLGGNMPAWKDKLSDEEIDTILEWIKAQWPDNIYRAWSERNSQQQ